MAVKKTETTNQASKVEVEVAKPSPPAGSRTSAPKAMDPYFTSLAALASMALVMVGLAVMIVYLFTHGELDTWVMAVVISKMVFLAILAGVGVAMLRGRAWAQQTLLAVWLLAMAYAAVILVVYVTWLDTETWASPDWWTHYMYWPLLAVVLPTLVCSGGAVVLLVLASARTSRARYASMVAVSVVAAITVAIGINVVCHKDFEDGGFGYRKDIESLGRYGIGDRTSRIMVALAKKKITLTCVYLPTKGKGDAEDKPNEHHDEIWEYLEGLKKKMEREDKSIEIVDVTSPIEQAKLQARLRRRHRETYSAHIALLEENFRHKSTEMIGAIQTAEGQWRELPDGAFLTLLGMSARVVDDLRDNRRSLEKIVNDIREAESDTSGLPDYVARTGDLKKSLDDARKSMEKINEDLKRAKGIPASVVKSREKVDAAMAAAGKAVDAMIKTLDGVADDKIKPAQAAAALGAFAKAAPLAVDAITVASDTLLHAAGKENSDDIRNSAYFSVSVVVPLPDGRGMVVREKLVSSLEQIIVPNLERLKATADDMVGNSDPEVQLRYLQRIERYASHWAGQFATARARTGEALSGLAKTDQETVLAFKQADEGKLFKGLLESVKGMLDAIENLPSVEGAALSSAVSEDNIVIVEIDRKTTVATHDELFPKQQRPGDRSPGQATGERVFNGDSALASKMLKMAFKPFGRVIVTYFDPPPQMMPGRRQPMPGSPMPIDPNQLGQLSKAIVAANFKVEQWNLANPGSKPKIDPKKKLPTILMVLPPPPPSPFGAMMGMPSPQFGEPHLAEIRKEIDSGTPAVFLTTYQPVRMTAAGFSEMPVPPKLEINRYLAKDWGIEIVNDARLILGNPDETRPGLFKINVEAFAYLPISTFTDHVIGRPLQGQRVFWLDACPIVQASEKKAGVEIEAVLTVPESMTNIWATKVRIGDLVRAIRAGGGLIKPYYDRGDVSTPMDLAVAAVREEDPEANRAESKIVVLSVGASMLDMYITRRIGVSDNKGGFSFDPPPELNPTLVVNSLYWLVDETDFIAAGPAGTGTIGTIDTATETVLKVMSMAGFPVIVLIVGALVMFFRRR